MSASGLREDRGPPGVGPEAPSSDHLNERWWLEHGGKEWFEEVQRRRPDQPHYHQQETFLQGFFLGLPPVRVLDFGCGFGRHLETLGQIPWLELYGCDISEQMVQIARERSGFHDAERRILKIEPRGRLPFEDDFFDVVFTSEVLIHVDSADLPQVLSELWRVSRSLILHIENPEVAVSVRENDAHDGCWRHGFRQAYDAFEGAGLWVLPNPVDLQTVYLVSKPTSLLGQAADSRRQAMIEVVTAALGHQRSQSVAQGLQLSRALLDLEDARRGQGTTGPRSLGLASRLRSGVRDLSALIDRPRSLAYGGFATRGTLSIRAFLADQPEVISICHPEWRGIRAATHAQVRHVLEIPGITSQAQCDKAVRFIAQSGARKIVINGFPPGIDHLAVQLTAGVPEAQVYVVYHGSPASDQAREDRVIQRMLELAERGQVKRLGFVKAGLAEYFQSLGYAAEQVMNRFSAPMRPASEGLRQEDRPHIGVFSQNSPHKNLVTQILAALMIPDSIVEVCELPPVEYLERARDRIVVHGILPHDEFMDVLSQVDASLYVSHSECYPMTVLESLAAGVVCLTSHTSELFDGEAELFEALVVSAHDNPTAISQQLRRALDRRLELIPLAQAHLATLDRRAEVRWQRFIDG